MSDSSKHDEMWHQILTGELPDLVTGRRFFKAIPSNPRCKICNAPFKGLGGQFVKVAFHKQPSKVNPHYCSTCYDMLQQHPGGTEIEMTLLFADIRGSTRMAEKMGTAAFSRLINRFYVAATEVFSNTDAWIERLVGDQVIGLYLPAMAGPQHARKAIGAAQDLLRALGYGSPDGAWLPLGVGVHTATAFMGSVGAEDGLRDITVLGDAPNTTARLSSVAAAGEILISEAACAHCGMDASDLEARTLQLKGRVEPINVRVMTVDSVERIASAS